MTSEYYEVDRIIDWKQEDGIHWYMVEWVGSGHEPTWVPQGDLKGCKNEIKNFKRRLQKDKEAGAKRARLSQDSVAVLERAVQKATEKALKASVEAMRLHSDLTVNTNKVNSLFGSLIS